MSPWSLPQPDDQRTRKGRRADDDTAMGFCKYCGDLILKELESGGVAFGAFWPLELI